METYPTEVQAILDKYDISGDLYEEAIKLQSSLESIGWTCDFDLGGEIFDIKKIQS